MTAVRLARALVRRAARLGAALAPDPDHLRTVGDAAGIAAALAAVDGFVAAPTPSRFLRAARLLDAAARAARAARLDSTFAGRAHAHGLARLRALPYLDPGRGAALAAYPVEPGAGRRLAALALLLEAHHELSARVRHVDAERQALHVPARAEVRRPTPARRPRPRRRADD